MKKLLLLMLAVCSLGLVGADARRLVPVGWEKSPAARELLSKVIEARNKLLISRGYYGTEKEFIVHKLFKGQTGPYVFKAGLSLKEGRELRSLRDKCLVAASKVSSFLISHASDWTLARFNDVFRNLALWNAQKEQWKILTQENIDKLKSNFSYFSLDGYSVDLWNQVGQNLKTVEDGINILVGGPQLSTETFEDAVAVGIGTLWSDTYVSVVSVADLKREAEERIAEMTAPVVTPQARKSRQVLSSLAQAFPAGVDLGAMTGAVYSWDKLVAWYKAVVVSFHPDKVKLDKIARGDFNAFFRAMQTIYFANELHDTYSQNGLGLKSSQWNLFKLPGSTGAFSPLLNATKPAEYATTAFRFLQEVYKIAQPTKKEAQPLDRNIVDFCGAILKFREDEVRADFNQATKWTLPLEKALDYQGRLNHALTCFDKINLGAFVLMGDSRSSLESYNKVAQNLYNFFSLYAEVLMFNGVKQVDPDAAEHSLLEVASTVLGRNLSRQKAMFGACDHIVRPTGSFATKELRKAMNIVSGMMRFFLDEQGFIKMRMVYKGLLGLDDPKLQEIFGAQSKEDIQKDLRFKVFGIGEGAAGAGDYLEIFTYARLQEYIASLRAMLIDTIYPKMNSSMKTQMLRRYQASWNKEGAAWASKTAFEADIDLLNQSLTQALNFLQGYCVLISQDPIPVVIRNNKDGQPMKVVKEVSPAVQQAVKLCQADVEFLKVVAFLGKDADGALWITKSPAFAAFYGSYVHNGKWAENFVGDMNAGTMVVDPRLNAVKRVATQTEGKIKAELGDDAQFFEFFVQDFKSCADLYEALPAASPAPSGTGGGMPAPGSGHVPPSSGTTGGYSMPGNVAAALVVAQEKYDALTAFDWNHAETALRRIYVQLYKKFAGQVALIRKGDAVTITKGDVQSKGLDKVGDNAEIKAWLDAWMALLNAVENPSASGASTGSGGTTGDKVGELLIELNQSLQLAAAAA